ncbi:MAG TPA: hypothetical protein HA254_07830 [Candidatus Diapherotrites archaeon]|uniref:Uncharacterized protein n=1 Tax=Candidatus Iainarchaeum sp. TaxID=3101447 RepID=A0A7J4J2A3_9ARCH|nr:hypothetical protein [Candidatus Diapherotrites archaeon]
MGMSIKTTVFPLRVSLKKKETWDLVVEVANEDAREKKVSVRIELPAEASFGTVGGNAVIEKRIDNYRALGTIQLKMPVYISNRANEGVFSGKVKVAEHFNDYDYIEKSYSKDIPLRIVQ